MNAARRPPTKHPTMADLTCARVSLQTQGHIYESILSVIRTTVRCVPGWRHPVRPDESLDPATVVRERVGANPSGATYAWPSREGGGERWSQRLKQKRWAGISQRVEGASQPAWISGRHRRKSINEDGVPSGCHRKAEFGGFIVGIGPTLNPD